MDISKIEKCRACGGKEFTKWIDLGIQPIANNLVKDINEIDESYYPLKLVVCNNCELVQTEYDIDPDIIFNNYLYQSSTSSIFRKHFETLAQIEFNYDRVRKGDLVVDIGSNDGILLKPFKELGAKVIGIEPAKNVAEVAEKNGIKTISDYFTKEVAAKIVKDYGKAKLVTATNVFAHIPNLDEVMEAIKILLSDDGRFMIEVAYLPRMLEQKTFDLVYHEHVLYWHLEPLIKYLDSHGFYVDEVRETSTHGGSIRVYAKYGNEKTLLAMDKNLVKTIQFKAFPSIIKFNREDIKKKLKKIKKNGKVIVGYGAPAKMSTVTNYFDIGRETIDYIFDDAVEKQGYYSPGKYIKIVPYNADILNEYVDYIFLFAWNFKDSIITKLRADGYRGKFIIPFPNIHIL